MKHLLRPWKEEEGQDLVEYALVLVLTSLAVAASIRSLASAVSDAFSNAAVNMTSASGT